MLEGSECAAVCSFMALLPTVNPVGPAPIFPAMIAGAKPGEQRQLAGRVSLYAFAFLTASTTPYPHAPPSILDFAACGHGTVPE